MLQVQEEKQQREQEQAAKAKQETPKKAEPVYIIDDDDDDGEEEDVEHLHADEIDAIAEEEEEQEDEEEESTPPHDLQSPPSYADTDSDCFDRQRGGRYTSDSESDFRPYKPSRSGRSTPEYAGGHRKSVSFDLSGDERSKSDYERSRSRTPDRFGRAYDSEQDTRAASRMPRKGILRATSPSSSTSSTLERRPERAAAAAPPIVPAVVRIREVESPSRVQHVSRATSPDPHPDELQRENPFRRQEDDDEYTKIAKAINRSPRSPRDQFFFSSTRSSEDLLETQSHSSGRSTPSTVISKSTENLTTGTRSKLPPPPTLPKPQLKKADLVRNVALETFQASDVGHGDFAVFEHDASTNTIHEVVPKLPKLPVRVVGVKSTAMRPRESPPPPPVSYASPPPVNYATLPKLPRSPKSPLPVEESLYMEALPAATTTTTPPSQRRPHDFVHENSPDNILVTPEQHRDFLLRENEMRNQLRAPHEPAPPIPIAGGTSYGVNNPFLDTADTDIDNLPLPPPPPTRTPSPPTLTTPTLSTLTLPAYGQLTHSSNASTSYASSNMPLEQHPLLLGSATPAQIFPMAQILPVQYASLPQPQQPNKLTLGGGGAAAAGATSSTFNLLLLPGGTDATQSTAGGLLYLQATPAQLSVSEATTTSSSKSNTTTPAPPTPVTPSYAAMKFPTFSEIVVTSVADSNSNYQNMSTSRVVGISNTSLGGNSTSSSFSINSSNSSLQQTTTGGGGRRLPAASAVSSYYETAEEIYSTIEEEAIYSNTAFFDSRRSSDTSLNLCPPPPLPPKRPLKPPPSKLRTAPAPPVAQKPQGLRGGSPGLANFKLRSQSQPQLVGGGAAGAGTGGVTPSTPTTPTGKETTV